MMFNEEVYEFVIKVVILVRAFINLKTKLEHTFSIFKSFEAVAGHGFS